MAEILTDLDIATEYLARGGLIVPAALVRWLTRRGLGHRNAVTIAEAVNKLQAERAERIAAPEQIAWQQNQIDGIGDPRERDMADRVAAMSMSEFSKFRAEAGLQPSVLDFLGGTA